MPVPVNRRIGLRNEKILLAISSKVFDLIRHTAFFHFSIGCLDKSELIDPSKSAHRANETNIWAFRCFDGTNTPVMRRMNVPHLESGAFAAEAARSKSGQTAFVR